MMNSDNRLEGGVWVASSLVLLSTFSIGSVGTARYERW